MQVLDKLTKAKVPSHLIIPRWGPDASPTAAAAKSDELGDLQIKKIRFAQKHGVEMVDSFWLVECMNDGRRIGEEFSRPKGDLGLLPAAAAGGTQAGGASQLPQTQMPAAATQVCEACGTVRTWLQLVLRWCYNAPDDGSAPPCKRPVRA